MGREVWLGGGGAVSGRHKPLFGKDPNWPEAERDKALTIVQRTTCFDPKSLPLEFQAFSSG